MIDIHSFDIYEDDEEENKIGHIQLIPLSLPPIPLSIITECVPVRANCIPLIKALSSPFFPSSFSSVISYEMEHRPSTCWKICAVHKYTHEVFLFFLFLSSLNSFPFTSFSFHIIIFIIILSGTQRLFVWMPAIVIACWGFYYCTKVVDGGEKRGIL